MFHNFFTRLARSRYLSGFSLTFDFYSVAWLGQWKLRHIFLLVHDNEFWFSGLGWVIRLNFQDCKWFYLLHSVGWLLICAYTFYLYLHNPQSLKSLYLGRYIELILIVLLWTTIKTFWCRFFSLNFSDENMSMFFLQNVHTVHFPIFELFFTAFLFLIWLLISTHTILAVVYQNFHFWVGRAETLRSFIYIMLFTFSPKFLGLYYIFIKHIWEVTSLCWIEVGIDGEWGIYLEDNSLF